MRKRVGNVEAADMKTFDIPDGKYTGRQSGFDVAATVNGKAVIWETDVAAKGNCAVEFRIAGGKLVHSSIVEVSDYDDLPLLYGIG